MIYHRLIPVLAFFIVLCSCRPEIETPQPTLERIQGKSGKLIRNGELSLIVNGWEEVEPDAFYTPEAGVRTLEVDVILVNASRLSIDFDAQYFSLTDSQGRKYTEPHYFTSIEIGGPILFGAIFPGDRLRMKIGYEVMKDASGFRLSLELQDWWLEKYPIQAEKLVYVELDRQPGIRTPPAFVEGELPVATISLDGGSRSCGYWSIQINEIQFRAPDRIILDMAGSREIEVILVDISIIFNGGEDAGFAWGETFWIQDWSGSRYPSMPLGVFYGYNFYFPDYPPPGEEFEGWIGFLIPLPFEKSVLVFNCGTSERLNWAISMV